MTDPNDRLQLFFSQSLDGIFFMMLDEPVCWNEATDKEAALDYVFEHERITEVNEAMLAQYGAAREQLIGLRPADLYRHDLPYGRQLWRDLFDRRQLRVETEERRLDTGAHIWIEGDYICLYDPAGRLIGHFGIQRDVTERRHAEDGLRQFNRRLQHGHAILRGILSSRSATGIAQAALSRLPDLMPCRRADLTVFDEGGDSGTLLAAYAAPGLTPPPPGSAAPLARFGSLDDLRAGKVRVLEQVADDDPCAALLRDESLGSCITVPLRAERHLVGAFSVGFEDRGPVDPEQVAVARELASILAVAIRQAQLGERVERHAAELETRVAERTADLQRSQQRLLAIAQALPDLVFVVDGDGRYLEILAGTNDLLARDAAELKGRRFHDVFPAPVADQFLGMVRRTIETGQLQVLEYPLQVPAGDRWFEGRATALDLGPEAAPAALFVARDITERKRAEALEGENIYLREELSVEGQFGEIVGSSRPMRQVFRNIALVAATDSTVLLLGQTGTGKELIARAIHEMSRRRAGPMIKVNCGALPASLAESELFGHERGAFTGALQQKKGRFELAHRGTIFLDEVGELSPDVQVKLLRVLQEHEIERVGGTQTIRIDARVIAATNRDLARAVQDGTFRSDLFYRLNIFPIDVPPLRDRKDDLPALVDHFVRAFARRIGRAIQGVAPAALERLQAYDWPGNVRELANVLERAVILCEGPTIQERHLGALKPPPPPVDAFPTLEEMERQHILRALQQAGGVLAGPNGAARLLGMSRSTVWSRMRKLGIGAKAHT